MSSLAYAGEAITILAIVLALMAITFTALALRRAATPLVERIDAVLPQTQCAQCGFAGCRPYANAIADGEAAINRCPPGGEPVIRKLARMTHKPYLEPDASCGAHKPAQIAVIDEARCIGCTLCIQACPVDAIVGAAKLMHTVIRSECTGCELCIPPCPVDCITLESPQPSALEFLLGQHKRAAQRARNRFEARKQRLERERRERMERLSAKAASLRAITAMTADAAAMRRRAIVGAALERARIRLAANATDSGR